MEDVKPKKLITRKDYETARSFCGDYKIQERERQRKYYPLLAKKREAWLKQFAHPTIRGYCVKMLNDFIDKFSNSQEQGAPPDDLLLKIHIVLNKMQQAHELLLFQSEYGSEDDQERLKKYNLDSDIHDPYTKIGINRQFENTPSFIVHLTKLLKCPLLDYIPTDDEMYNKIFFPIAPEAEKNFLDDWKNEYLKLEPETQEPWESYIL